MQIRTLALTDGASAARLLIHTGAERGAQEHGLAALLRRLRAWHAARPPHERQPAALEIHDLQGQRILAVREASPLVEVALPPGTYHVTTRVDGIHRRYTVTLEAGASFDLRLSTTRDGRAG